jgi:transcriptional regulator with GAF, ATPase, and Fis domain
MDTMEARLNEALRRVGEYELVIEALRSFGDSLDARDALRQILDASLRVAQAHQGSLTLLDASADTPAQTLLREGAGGDRILDHFLNLLLSGWAHRNGRAMWSDRLSETFGSALPARYQSVASALSVPIFHGDEVVGVINLVSLNPAHRFGEREAELVGILAGQCSKSLRNARQHEALQAETTRLRQEVAGRRGFVGIVGSSPAMRQLFTLVERVASTEGRVLIEGESGTGKERIARVVHQTGPRKDTPFVAIDCGALPVNLLESELFGYVKGAFTGADAPKRGLFEEAHTGTLFLDEVANMPMDVQAKLLRVLQEGEIRPLGATQSRPVDVRVLAASSQPLRQCVAEGTFRPDLFYRLSVVTLTVPPLRDRRSDISLLARHFLEQKAGAYNPTVRGFLPETVAALEAYNWPGNVRELENAVERMLVLSEPGSTHLAPEWLPADLNPAASRPAETEDWSGKRAAYERQLLLDALTRMDWNQSAAARELGLSESTLRYRMQRLDLRRPTGEAS